MKKLILPALCLTMTFGTMSVSATSLSNNTVITLNEDGRKTVKQEELPEAVTKTLAGDAYKGWTIKEAALVTQATAEHYEVTLANEKETKVVKLHKDGTLVN